MALKPLFGLAWIVRGRKPGASAADTQVAERFVEDNEAAVERVLDLRHQIPDPLATWRCHDGTWERWSWLDGEFRVAPPPAALVAYAGDRDCGVVPDEVLVLQDAAWRTEAPDERAAREQRHDPVDLGEPDDLGQVRSPEA